MKSSHHSPGFVEDIFPKELEEIAKRRRTQNLRGPELSGEPSVEKGLIGLAFTLSEVPLG